MIILNGQIEICLCLSDTFGWFYSSPEFGLIADPKRVLGPLPKLFAELEADEVWFVLLAKSLAQN